MLSALCNLFHLRTLNNQLDTHKSYQCGSCAFIFTLSLEGHIYDIFDTTCQPDTHNIINEAQQHHVQTQMKAIINVIWKLYMQRERKGEQMLSVWLCIVIFTPSEEIYEQAYLTTSLSHCLHEARVGKQMLLVQVITPPKKLVHKETRKITVKKHRILSKLKMLYCQMLPPLPSDAWFDF